MLLITAIAQVESANRNVPGDNGAALSVYQIHREAWQDVKNRFGARLEIGERWEDIGQANLTSHLRADNCARGYVALIEERLLKYQVEPTAENIYACWNLGFEGFKKRHFELRECPMGTIRNANKVAALANHKPKPAGHHD